MFAWFRVLDFLLLQILSSDFSSFNVDVVLIFMTIVFEYYVVFEYNFIGICKKEKNQWVGAGRVQFGVGFAGKGGLRVA